MCCSCHCIIKQGCSTLQICLDLVRIDGNTYTFSCVQILLYKDVQESSTHYLAWLLCWGFSTCSSCLAHSDRGPDTSDRGPDTGDRGPDISPIEQSVCSASTSLLQSSGSCSFEWHEEVKGKLEGPLQSWFITLRLQSFWLPQGCTPRTSFCGRRRRNATWLALRADASA
jgi:hypothetical protein